MKEKKIDDFESIMKSKSLKEKIRFLDELGKDDSPKTIQYLISLLYSQSWSIRDKAAEILGKKGEKIIDKILNLLDDGIWFTRASAAKTLGYLGSIIAVPHLLKHLEDSNNVVKNNIIEALKNIVEKNGIESLEANLSKEDFENLKKIILKDGNP